MKRILILTMILILLLTGCTSKTPEPTTETEEDILYVHFIDVGQADCTLLKLGDCEILIDGGNVADGPAVVNYLTQLGVDELELVISTHPHEDHAGGLTWVLKNFIADEVWVTAASYVTTAYTDFISAIKKQGLPIYIPSLGESYTYGDLTLTVLGPVDDYTDTNTNNTSIVVMARYGERKFLFTGDMESDAEADLLATGADLQADVLKVGHHGSYSASSDAFLAAVSPSCCVIPVGRNNDYGHPHTVAMNRLRNAGINIYRTDLMGTVIIATDGETLTFLWTAADAKPEINATETVDEAA